MKEDEPGHGVAEIGDVKGAQNRREDRKSQKILSARSSLLQLARKIDVCKTLVAEYDWLVVDPQRDDNCRNHDDRRLGAR